MGRPGTAAACVFPARGAFREALGRCFAPGVEGGSALTNRILETLVGDALLFFALELSPLSRGSGGVRTRRNSAFLF